jgi:GGDEF domain-containing protein
MPDDAGEERSLLQTTIDAQRAILRARRPDDVVTALARTVQVLGGRVVPGHINGDEVLHLDLALGVRDAVLPWAPPDDPSRERIQRVLPALLEDARRQLHLLWALEDLDDPSLRDELTGALHAEATRRLVGRASAADTLVGFSLTGVAAIEEVHGGARLEVLLRQLAGFVRSELDVDERLGRLAGPTLVALLPHAPDGRPEELMDRVSDRWERQRELPVPMVASSVSIGDDSPAALATLAHDLGATSGLDASPARA